MGGRVYAVGSINTDLQVASERWPGPGEASPVRRFLMHGGGKAANVAYMARRLGAEASLIGRVGDDLLCEEALRSLREAGIDLSAVGTAPGQSTGVAIVVVPPGGNKVIFFAPNANDDWPADAIRAAADLLTAAEPGSILAANLEARAAVVRAALRAARDRGLRTILDPSPAPAVTDEICALADFITPNESEAEHLTGVAVRSVEDARRAGRALLGRGVGTALVKLGGQGCVLVDRDGRSLHVAPPHVEAVDTTGGGDAFAGALAAAMLEGHPLAEALRWAVAAAACAVTGFGAQPSYPTRAKFETMLSRVPAAS